MLFDQFEFLSSYGTFSQLPPSSCPEIAFAGRSNVGKSSMLNTLMKRKSLARVSSTPGKTVTINFYGAPGVRFADLPGYGYAKVARGEKQRWAAMLEGYFTCGRDIRLTVLLLDMRHNPTAEDRDMLLFLKDSGMPFCAALTKSDKLNKSEYSERLKAIQEILLAYAPLAVVPFSSQTGEGAEEVRRIILKAIKS